MPGPSPQDEEFIRSRSAELYHDDKRHGINPERWDRIRQQDFLQIAEEITGQRCLKNSFVRCPFHGSDSTPSFKVYDNDAYCFGCAQFYDAVALVAKHRDIGRVKALAWLEHYYNLPPMEDVAVEPDEDEHELTFAQVKPAYIRFAAADIQARASVGLAREYLCLYFEGKQEGSSLPLLRVLGPEAILRIAKEHGLE